MAGLVYRGGPCRIPPRSPRPGRCCCWCEGAYYVVGRVPAWALLGSAQYGSGCKSDSIKPHRSTRADSSALSSAGMTDDQLIQIRGEHVQIGLVPARAERVETAAKTAAQQLPGRSSWRSLRRGYDFAVMRARAHSLGRAARLPGRHGAHGQFSRPRACLFSKLLPWLLPWPLDATPFRPAGYGSSDDLSFTSRDGPQLQIAPGVHLALLPVDRPRPGSAFPKNRPHSPPGPQSQSFHGSSPPHPSPTLPQTQPSSLPKDLHLPLRIWPRYQGIVVSSRNFGKPAFCQGNLRDLMMGFVVEGPSVL
ncbi:hypothetical protein KVR01_003385 [Diaporthe batatas]|uniref:uncharacterized protein n=1 Tax=Diaporthe batatas TaxID=748121 RepID=UPI001D0487BB|nr:uncharacterized protein KVR01_003385 [Diaporthe batatas]KAG8167696.1 hypothetical protein KVR01_003385 [Diaporthe batatas]